MYLVIPSIYFWNSLLTSNYESFCIFLYSMYASANILTSSAQNWELMNTTQFQAILVHLNPPNGVP